MGLANDVDAVYRFMMAQVPKFKLDHTRLVTRGEVEAMVQAGSVVEVCYQRENRECVVGYGLFDEGHAPTWRYTSLMIDPAWLKRVLLSNILEELARKALVAYGIEALRAEVFGHQTQAIAILERFGFVPIAQIDKYACHQGRPVPLLWYERTKEVAS